MYFYFLSRAFLLLIVFFLYNGIIKYMPRIHRNGFTLQQMAFARRTFAAKEGETKETVALDCGYNPYAARSTKSKIEQTKGYQNAIAALARDSHNIAVSVMAELQSRGFEEYTNKDLVSALNAISLAWSRFSEPISRSSESSDPSKNRLRTIVLQQIENQTIVPSTKNIVAENGEGGNKNFEESDLDF
jgi:hypothetical protein